MRLLISVHLSMYFLIKRIKKNKVRICIEGNHFIDIKVDTEEQAIKIINKIKEDMCGGN